MLHRGSRVWGRGGDSSFSTGEVTEAVKQMLSGRAPEMDEVHEVLEGSGCCRAVLVNTPLQYCVEIRGGI